MIGADFSTGPVFTVGMEFGCLRFIGPGEAGDSWTEGATFPGGKAFANLVILSRAGDGF